MNIIRLYNYKKIIIAAIKMGDFKLAHNIAKKLYIYLKIPSTFSSENIIYSVFFDSGLLFDEIYIQDMQGNIIWDCSLIALKPKNQNCLDLKYCDINDCNNCIIIKSLKNNQIIIKEMEDIIIAIHPMESYIIRTVKYKRNLNSQNKKIAALKNRKKPILKGKNIDFTSQRFLKFSE